MENIKIELIKVFGPSVLKATIPEKIISEIKLIIPDKSVIPSLNVANKIIINKILTEIT